MVLVTGLAGCGNPGDPPQATEEVDVARAGQLSEGSRHEIASAISVPMLTWAPCGETFPGADCAVAQVPLDYDDPRGPATGIALARIAAADRDHKLGTLFVNPGGPGGSGVGLVLSGFGDLLQTLLQGKFDIVGFDPRGVGSSEPLRCFDSADAENAFFAGLPVFPYRADQALPYFRQISALSGQCLGGQSRIAAHMSTADVVRDLDLLRQAVGDGGLSYLGFSYGSFIGNSYARLFPRRVRALVIDGVLDPQRWSSGRQIDDDRVAPAHEFAEFLRLCDEAGTECALAGPGGSAARYQALADALRAQPLIIEGTFTYGYDLLVADTTNALYVPEYWGGPAGYAAFFAALADAVAGDVAAGLRAKTVREAIRERLRHATATYADYDNGLDAFYGTMCADTEFPVTFAEFRRVGAYAERGSFFGPLFWWQNVPCARWPVSPDRYTGPWNACTSAPALVVGNLFDGITGYDGAVASSAFLAGSRLLTYAGWGHTAFGRSACVTEHVVAYLLDGTLPPEGTVCPANPNPFVAAPPTARVASASAARVGAGDPMIGLPPSRP